MGRLVLALAIGLVGAIVVHIAVIFTIPTVAENNAWGRLSRLGGLYTFVEVAALRGEGPDAASLGQGSQNLDFAFVDPAFVTAACRFALADGPVRLAAAEETGFWSASVYNRRGDNLYSINDRSAVGGKFDLLLGTTEQLVEARATSAERDETAIPVEINILEGYITLRVLVDEESERPEVNAFVRSVVCESLAAPTADRAVERLG